MLSLLMTCEVRIGRTCIQQSYKVISYPEAFKFVSAATSWGCAIMTNMQEILM